MLQIPTTFWVLMFDGDVAKREAGSNGVRRTTFTDGRVAFEDWDKGNFAVHIPVSGGKPARVWSYEGVQINAADLMNEFSAGGENS